jgi:hypothetical protein
MVLGALLTGGCGSHILFPVLICITGTVCSVRRGGVAEGAVITCIVIGEKTGMIWNPHLIKPKPSPSTTVLRVQHTGLQDSRVTIVNTKITTRMLFPIQWVTRKPLGLQYKGGVVV